MRRVVFAAALCTLAASGVSAQVTANRFTVTTRVGTITPERSSSMNTAGEVGLDTEYAINKYFGLGVSVDVAHGNTHREDFLVRIRYGNSAATGGDTLYYNYVGQPVNTIHLGLFGLVRYPTGRISPFAMAGVGNYTMLLDTQINGSAQRKNEMSYTLGAGVWVKLSDRTGVQLDVRSLTMQNFSRSFLDPTQGKNQNTVFPEDFPAVPAAKNTARNLMLTLGFRYVPGAPGGN